MDDKLTRALKAVTLIALILLLGWVTLAFLIKISIVVVVLVGATFFAYLVYPAVVRLQRWRLPRWAAISVVYLFLALIIGGLFSFIGPRIAHQSQLLAADFPSILASAKAAIVGANTSLLGAVPIEARQTAVNVLDELVTAAQSAAGDFAGHALKLALSVASIITGLVIVPLLAFYILLDLERLRDTVTGLFPARHRQQILLVLKDIDLVLGGFIRGQVVVACVVAVMVTMLLVILRIKYALLIGVFAGAVDIIPYVGAFAGAIPAVLVALFNIGPLRALAVALGFIVIYELEGHVIAPTIVGHRVGLSPLFVIIAILIGAELGGIGGMFVAVPIAGIIRVLWKRFTKPAGALEVPGAPSREVAASTLLVEATATEAAAEKR